jgi:hypothetical protein
MVIDARGRLLGRFNLIDAAVVVLAVALGGMGYVGYTVVRLRPPAITGVMPARVTTSTATGLQLTGRYFRPYFNAFVSRTGEPYSLPSARAAEYLIGTPTAVELRLPPLEAGTYDIHLYDGGHEVARRELAFSIDRPPSRTGS